MIARRALLQKKGLQKKYQCVKKISVLSTGVGWAFHGTTALQVKSRARSADCLCRRSPRHRPPPPLLALLYLLDATDGNARVEAKKKKKNRHQGTQPNLPRTAGSTCATQDDDCITCATCARASNKTGRQHKNTLLTLTLSRAEPPPRCKLCDQPTGRGEAFFPAPV